jgi:integrase
MGQRVRETNLDNKSLRQKLKPAGKPYWKRVREGLHLGYRRSLKGGVWVSRIYAGGKYVTGNIGTADNFSMKPAEEFVSFEQAQDRLLALADAACKPAAPAGPYTVDQALNDYFSHSEANGSKSIVDAKQRADKLIRPALGSVPVDDLTREQLKAWHNSLSKRGDPKSQDDIRRKKSTANRVLAIMKASLNFAFREGRVTTDVAWRAVKPFGEVETARVRHFSVSECQRLVNSSRGAFRDLVNAALFSGCRYGELCRLRVRDFRADSGTIYIERSKSGNARHVVLTEEGQAFFRQMTAGRLADDVMFLKNGLAWSTSHQVRYMAEACKNANIAPAGFHILRHSYASLLVMNGAPLTVIAANLGHANTKMVEKHYGHMTQSYLAEQIRKHSPEFGTIEKTNIVTIGSRANG